MGFNLANGARYGADAIDAQNKATDIANKDAESKLKQQTMQDDLVQRQKQNYLEQVGNQVKGLADAMSKAQTPEHKKFLLDTAEHMKQAFGGIQAQQLGVDQYVNQAIDLATQTPTAFEQASAAGQNKVAGLTAASDALGISPDKHAIAATLGLQQSPGDLADINLKNANADKARAEAKMTLNPFGDDPSIAGPTLPVGSGSALPQIPDGSTPDGSVSATGPGMQLPASALPGQPLAPASIKPTAAAPTSWSANPVNEDFLATLPKKEQTIIKALARGDMAFPSSFALKSPVWMKVLSDLPNYDPTANGNRLANRKQFDTGPLGNQVTSFNKAVAHLGTLNDLVDALGNGDIKRINQMDNSFKTEFGQAAPTNFDTAKAIVGNEIVKAIVGSGGSSEDRSKAQDVLDKANSPQALKGVINTYTQLMAGQLHGIKKQYEDATNHNDFMTRLLPETRAAMVGAQFGVPNAAMKALQHDSSLAEQFDQKYGPGLSREILGK